MAKEKVVKAPKPGKEVVVRPVDPYIYFVVGGRWKGMVGGVSPSISTTETHLAKMVEDEEKRIRRDSARTRPSQAREAESVATEAVSAEASTEVNGSELAEAVEEAVKSERRKWLEEALQDTRLDAYAKTVIENALKELNPAEKLVRQMLKMTNTFPMNGGTNFFIPKAWLYGGLKAAVQADGLYPYEDAAQRLAKRCVVIHPDRIDLGVGQPDNVHTANVTLGRVGPGEAQASIKRFHMVRPRDNHFTLVIAVLDSPFAAPLVANMQRVFTVIGNNGLGGGRPSYGQFEVVECRRLPKNDEGDQEAKELIARLAAKLEESGQQEEPA
ncbi:hypothetical protein HYZ64_03270 [Candidatus Berkelbacteria bacterium]|nr:hypothetical protein [Candidatus Berkelbacteria bacterium]